MDESGFWNTVESTRPRAGLMDRLASKSKLAARLRERHLDALRAALEAMPAE